MRAATCGVIVILASAMSTLLFIALSPNIQYVTENFDESQSHNATYNMSSNTTHRHAQESAKLSDTLAPTSKPLTQQPPVHIVPEDLILHYGVPGSARRKPSSPSNTNTKPSKTTIEQNGAKPSQNHTNHGQNVKKSNQTTTVGPTKPTSTSKVKAKLVSESAKSSNLSSNLTQIQRDVLEAARLSPNDTEITLVTMFLSLGSFRKGPPSHVFTEKTYRAWMSSWQFVSNPVIAFFDNDDILELFRNTRSFLPSSRTTLIKISRQELPSFRDQLSQVRAIFSRKGYPKHHPNTVVPEYACAMNAKYDVVDKVLRDHVISTKYLAWMDIGLLRLEHSSRKPISLHTPPEIDSSKISYTQVSPGKSILNQSPWDMIKSNSVWMAGGYFLATPQVMSRHIQAFRGAVKELISKKILSTDQQTISALYSGKLQQKSLVEIQGYHCTNGQYKLQGDDANYFCLTYMCKAAGEAIYNQRRKKGR